VEVHVLRAGTTLYGATSSKAVSGATLVELSWIIKRKAMKRRMTKEFKNLKKQKESKNKRSWKSFRI
jgi:hypothetical protein